MNTKHITLLVSGLVGFLLVVVLGSWYSDSRTSNKDEIMNTTTHNENEVFGDASDGFEGIPESEILSGGPGKDGIPSIDDPKFVAAGDASFVEDDEFGIGLTIEGESRFYPFSILVWHEIVNDTVAGVPVAVTYCPLCRTGVTYERRINVNAVEFGVSGKLWKSNLLMYNRSEPESLWSQVLGRAVTGAHTGTRLRIVSSDTVQFSDWRREHPNTRVLSRDTGAIRRYGADPYGDYYTNRDVSFGATFSDARLHPKEYVLGVERNGAFKAYVADTLPTGVTTDTFAGATIKIEKSAIGEVRMFADDEPLPYIGGFWFSWLAVHPDTQLRE